MKLSTLFLVLVIFSFGCGQSQQNEDKSPKTTTSEVSDTTQSSSSAGEAQNIDTSINLKIYVDKTGNITVNGKASSLNELDNQLKTLKSQNGIVFYSRDNVADDPSEQSMEVMELVLKYELPLMFYTDNTFTQPVKIN